MKHCEIMPTACIFSGTDGKAYRELIEERVRRMKLKDLLTRTVASLSPPKGSRG